MLLQMSVIIKFSLPHIVGSLYPEKYWWRPGAATEVHIYVYMYRID